MNPIRRIPSVASMRSAWNYLRYLVEMTGPNQPEGFVEAVRVGEAWAVAPPDGLNWRILESVGFLAIVLTPPPGSGIAGWPTPAIQALSRVQMIAKRILADWPVIPSPPGTLALPLGVAAVVSDHDHAGLRSALGILTRQLEEAGREAAALVPFTCSKAELLIALGQHRSYFARLDEMIEQGELIIDPAIRPRGHAKHQIVLTDPEEHARIVAKIRANRASR